MRAELLAGVIAAPDDDRPRLVYAAARERRRAGRLEPLDVRLGASMGPPLVSGGEKVTLVKADTLGVLQWGRRS